MEVVGGLTGGMEGGVSFHIPAPIGGMEVVAFTLHLMMVLVVVLAVVLTDTKTNPETCHAKYPQSVSAMGDTRCESPHSPRAGC